MLFLVSTPIGNLSDITYRAIDILNSSDYVLCEDTRHSLVLLNHYKIKKKLIAFHLFTEKSLEEQIIHDLKAGKQISLISDGGTPGISDPGEKLVKRCREENIPVSAAPGACALITALSISGFPTAPFQFIGFFERKETSLKKQLVNILQYQGTTIGYESPKRILSTVQLLASIAPDCTISIARELTKKFESFLKGSSIELSSQIKSEICKGEITLIIQGNQSCENEFNDLSPKEHVEQLMQSYKISEKEAVKLAAELRGVPKKLVYKSYHID